MPTKAELELIVEQLKRQLQDAEQRADRAEAEALERLNARQAGEAGGPWMSVQDWERLWRDDGATLQNQEWLEAQRRDAEIRRD